MVPWDVGPASLMKRMRGEATPTVFDRADAAVAIVHREGGVEEPEYG
jgi:hypothetical protein